MIQNPRKIGIHAPQQAPQKSFQEPTVGLPDKIQDAQVNLDFRYARNKFLVVTCPMHVYVHIRRVYAIKIIHKPEEHLLCRETKTRMSY